MKKIFYILLCIGVYKFAVYKASKEVYQEAYSIGYADAQKNFVNRENL